MLDLKTPETYDDYRHSSSIFHKQKYGEIFKHLSKNKVSKVVELACGTGIYTKFLLDDFPFVIATDIDKKMVKIAKEKLKCKFVVCDSTIIPFKDGSIDLVVGISILHHVPNKIDVIKESRRILKTNSFFAFCEPNKLSPISFAVQSYLREPSISRFEMKRLMNEADTKIIAIREILFRYPGFLENIDKQLPFYGKIERFFEKIHQGGTLLSVGMKN